MVNNSQVVFRFRILQHRYGNEEMGEAFCTGGASSPSDQADVLPVRRGHKEFISEGGGENESLARGGISEEDGADLLSGEKIESSSLETEEGEARVVGRCPRRREICFWSKILIRQRGFRGTRLEVLERERQTKL